MSFSISGLSELMNDISAMAARLDTTDENAAVTQAILENAAEPIHEQMLHNATTDPQKRTGAIYRSIKIGSVKKRKLGGKRITIGVHHKAEGAYYAVPLEFGHGGPAPAPPHPFVRPAFDVRADEAYGRIKEGLIKALKSKNAL